ncbi:H-type small acid-soluble spore protein [Heyndrickxia acidiproducens]|uniref:H-type small acid-soluble spore protein n=1 Tax=Heyndrickxia acidiproducens TaxID=1121084 RepID=UPI000379B867|nr:H-type small acid-soluble spore protein [Heyndrickxia acidiproducens]
MDAQRVQDIMDSSEMVNVTLNGEGIYIEHVDRKNGKATVHPLDNPDQKQSVQVSNLIEH